MPYKWNNKRIKYRGERERERERERYMQILEKHFGRKFILN